MFIKISLAENDNSRMGWRYIFDVSSCDVIYPMLNEMAVYGWMVGRDIIECEGVAKEGNSVTFTPRLVDDIPRQGEEWKFCSITADTSRGQYTALVNTPTYLCRDDGQTAQRLI